MFKSILKGFKWFFSVPDETKVKITRKHNHAHIPAVNAGHSIKVYKAPADENIIDNYNRMVDFKVQFTPGETDTIESAKKELWWPHGVTDKHKEHILAMCGFQKTSRHGNDMVYDPRLIQVINYAMNMYAAEVAYKVNEITSQLDTKLD